MCELNRKYLETEKESQQLLVLLPAPSPPHCPHCCHSLPFSEPGSPSKPRMASGHNQGVHSILTTKPPSFKFDITIIQNVYFVYRIYFNVLSSLQVAPAKCSLCSRDRFEVVAAYHASLIELCLSPVQPSDQGVVFFPSTTTTCCSASPEVLLQDSL